MYTKIYNSITEIDEDQWDSIVGRNKLICTHCFLEAVEKSNINDCKYFYPVVYDNDKIVAHACAYSISMELDVFVKGIAKKVINTIRKVWKNFLILKLTECGTPIALGNTISFMDGIDKKFAFSLIINEIENMARKEKKRIILIRDFYDEDVIFFDSLISSGFKRVYNLPNTILKVPWKSFDEYISNLRSKYRSTILRRIKIATNKGLVIEIVNNFSSLSQKLLSLWFNSYENAKEYRREILTNEFFINIKKYLGDISKILLFKYENNIIGFGLVALDDDLLRCLFLGLDYKYIEKLYVYNNSLYCVIKLAIAEKKKEIDLGITTYNSKIEVGAEVVNLYMYIKHINPFVNRIVTNLFNIMNPKREVKKVNVFKEKIENTIELNNTMVYSSKK